MNDFFMSHFTFIVTKEYGIQYQINLQESSPPSPFLTLPFPLLPIYKVNYRSHDINSGVSIEHRKQSKVTSAPKGAFEV